MKHIRFNRLSFAIKHSLIAVSLLGSSMASVSAFADTAVIQPLQIASGPLAQAVNQLAEQTGILLTYDAKLMEGKRSTGLKGRYNLESGFAALLTQHGLQLQKTTAGYTIITHPKTKAYSIERATTDHTDDQDTVQLPVIVLQADKNNIANEGRAEDGYLVKNISTVGAWGARNLQDTPYSMSVIPRELIDNIQANDMAQIFKMNPLTQDAGDQAAGNYMSVIRGFSSINPIVNGMPLAYYHSFTTMEDLERVETISGATGFLYGGGRVGGAVNYVSKKPTLESMQSIRVGNYGGSQYYGHLDLGGQINDNNLVGYRINALYQDGESVAKVAKEQKFASITLDYKPTDNLILDLNYAHRELNKNNLKPIFYVDTFRPKLDISKNYSSDWTATEEENDRLMSSIKWKVNEIFSLRGSLLYEKSNRKLIATQGIYTRPDGLYDAYNYKYPDQAQESKNYSGNIYLDSQFNTLGLSHLLTIGYSENYQKYLMPKNRAKASELKGTTLEEITNSSLPDGNISHSPLLADNKMQYKNILIGDDITFNEQWSALVGFNYATIIQTSYSNGLKKPAYEKSALTPTLSLMYKPFDALTTYATYIESLEAGAIVGDSYSNAGDILDPLISQQYEVGAKYSFNDRLLFTGALFRIKKANQYSDLATPMPKYVQDGEQVHQGIEFTFTGKLTDDLTLMGGGTWMDLTVEKSNDPTLQGKKPVNAAAKMAKIYAEYAMPQINGLVLSGGAYYTAEKYGNASNTDVIPAYTLFDVGVRYTTQIAQHPTVFNLTVSNITGKDYWASSTYLGDPRTIAFSVKTQF